MNSYRRKQEQAEKRLQKLLAAQARLDANAVPGTYITGASGVPASRLRKLDRQLERTIELAKSITYVRQQVVHYRARADELDAGLIHPNGRPVKTAKAAQTVPPKEKLAWEDRLFIGVYPAGLVFCDMGVLVNGDYKPLAFLGYDDITLEWEDGVSERWKARIEAHAAQYKAGDVMQVSTCGQTITWGKR